MLVKLRATLSSIWSDIVDTYKRTKVLLLAVLAAIVYLEWEKIKAALLVYSGQKELSGDKKEDQALATQESSDNQQANTLANKAKDEPNPGDDWYKK